MKFQEIKVPRMQFQEIKPKDNSFPESEQYFRVRRDSKILPGSR